MACGSKPITMNEDHPDFDTHSMSELGGIARENLQEREPPRTKPLSILRTIIGECLCEAFPAAAADTSKGLSQASQFIQLHGLEYIGLGAMIDELTPKERVYDTLEQISTKTERLISIGYLVDDESTKDHRKITESIPLEVWYKAYPNDKNMSKPVLKTIEKLKAKEFGIVLEEFRKDLESRKRRILRDDNMFKIGISAHNIGVISILAQRIEMIIPFFEEAIKLKRDAFGPDHPEVAVSLDELGIQQFAREDFEEALSSFHEARNIRSSSFGPFHPKVAMGLNNIACCNFQMGNLKNAALNMEEAYNVVRKNSEKSTAASAELDLLHKAITLNNFGYLKLNLKQYEEAQSLFEEALLVQQSVLGDAHNHRAIRDTRSNLEFTNAFHS